MKPDERRKLAKYAIQKHSSSKRQTCRMMNLGRSVSLR